MTKVASADWTAFGAANRMDAVEDDASNRAPLDHGLRTGCHEAGAATTRPSRAGIDRSPGQADAQPTGGAWNR